jgi:hypothetical protein
MAESGGISYVISLDSADAEQQLENLKTAAEGLAGSFEKMAAAIEEGGLGALSTLLEVAGAAVVGLTGALFGMAKASSTVVDELGQMAAQMGATVEEMSTLQSALISFQANGETLGRALQRMGNTIQEMWPDIQKSIRDAAIQIAGDQNNIERSTINLAKAQVEAVASGNAVRLAYLSINEAALTLSQAHAKVAETSLTVEKNALSLEQALHAQQQAYIALGRASADAGTQQINDALGIKGAQLSVTDAEIALKQLRGQDVPQQLLDKQKLAHAELTLAAAKERLSEAQIKASRDAQDSGTKAQQLELQAEAADQAVAEARQRQTQQALQNRLLLLQVQQAQLGLSEAQKKAVDSQIQGESNLLSVQESQLRLTEARNKQRENELNSIDNLKARVDGLAQGASRGVGAAGLSVDNFIKGLIASVGSGVTSLEGLGGSFGEVTKNAPEARLVLLKLADAFHNMSDGTQKLAIATKLFGRKDAKDMVESLSEGSAAILEEEQRLHALGLEITDLDEHISKKFTRAMNQLGNAVGIVGTQFGLLFQPAFTVLLDGLRTALENNRETVIKWGEAIRDTVGPVIESLGRALAGTAVAGKDDWAVRMIANIQLFGTAVQAVIGGVVIPLFRGLLQMAEGVAFGINQVFGTAFTGLEILIGAVLTRLAIAFTSLLLAAGPVGLGIIGISLALGLLITYWPQVQKAATDAADAIASKWEELKATFAAWVTTPVANAWQWIKDTFNDTVGWVSTKIDETKALINAWVTTPVANAWKWIKDTWNANVPTFMQFGAGGSVSSGGDSGFAGGGLLGGRGSGTSDSNLAWVSRGEYITPARAVAQPGVLDFLEALRRSGGNLRNVLDGMGRFALGGLVAPISIPAFAGGGMNHVTIQFPGLPAITGLRASSDVVEELRRSAALAQVRSGGRKPSRFS